MHRNDEAEHDDRRSFLKKAGTFAAITPPAVTFLLSTSMSSKAIAASGGGGGGPGQQPGTISGDPGSGPGNPGNPGNPGKTHTGPAFGTNLHRPEHHNQPRHGH